MVDGLLLLLEWSLRAFGVFWVVGGAFTLKQARQANLIDTVLESITQEKEDRLVSRFLLVGAWLTILSGIGLTLASRWVLIPLSLLILSQAIYFAIQGQRFDQAQTDEKRNEARVARATRNAFVVCLIVGAIALIGVRLGLLR